MFDGYNSSEKTTQELLDRINKKVETAFSIPPEKLQCTNPPSPRAAFLDKFLPLSAEEIKEMKEKQKLERKVPDIVDLGHATEELARWLKTTYWQAAEVVGRRNTVPNAKWVYKIVVWGGKFREASHTLCFISRFGDIHAVAGYGFDKVPRGNIFNETGRNCFNEYGVKFIARGVGVYSNDSLPEKYDWTKWEL